MRWLHAKQIQAPTLNAVMYHCCVASTWKAGSHCEARQRHVGLNLFAEDAVCKSQIEDDRVETIPPSRRLIVLN